jgi:hypothetical protein
MSSSTTLDRPTTATEETVTADLDAAFRDIVDNEEKVEDDGTGDHELLSHYVSREDIVKASTTGVKVYALCGKKWTPTRNPENYPVCPECKAVYLKMRDE